MDYLILKFRLHRLHPTLKNESSDHVVLQQVLWTWGKLSLLIKWTLPFLNLPIFKRTNHPPAKGEWIWRPRLQLVWFALDAYTAHLETLRDNLTWLKERLVKMLYHIIWTCQSLVCNWVEECRPVQAHPSLCPLPGCLRTEAVREDFIKNLQKKVGNFHDLVWPPPPPWDRENLMISY